VPRVAVALDISRFLMAPCRLVSEAQGRALGIVGPAEPDVDSGLARARGPACTWPTGGGKLDVSFLGEATHGLSDLYRNRRSYVYFEPTYISGYPTVLHDTIDGRTDGHCQLAVGVADTRVVRVAAHASAGGTDACKSATDLASAIVETLRQA